MKIKTIMDIHKEHCSECKVGLLAFGGRECYELRQIKKELERWQHSSSASDLE